MKLLGTITKGDQVFEVPANTKRVSRYVAPTDGKIVKLTIYCDGLGSGVGDQVVRGVIYAFDGTLMAIGDEVVIKDGQPPDWVDLRFSKYPNGVAFVAGQKYDFGYLAGEFSNSMRVYGRASVGV